MIYGCSRCQASFTPGPDTLYIVGRSSTLGLRAGAVAALGIGAGILVHICATAFGLSALLSASATAFAVVKIAGAAYLVYVGVCLLRTNRAQPSSPAPGLPRTPMRSIFFQGFLTNVLNPKVALFFLAFLPQFVTADAPSKPLTFIFLGAIFDFNGTLWNLLLAWSTANLSSRFAAGDGFKIWFNRCVGSLFVLVGIRLALARER